MLDKTSKVFKKWWFFLLFFFLPMRTFALNTVITYAIDYSSTNVTTGAWVQITAATTQNIAFMCIYDTSGSILKIAYGPSGNEAFQFYIPAGGQGCFPSIVPLGARISIEADNTNATTGTLRINALY